jgi:hypothetical protein
MLALFGAPPPAVSEPTQLVVTEPITQVRDSEEIREKILALLSEGTFLRQIARMPGMPSTQAIRNWRKADPDFDKEIEDARLAGCDAIAEDIFEIIDDKSGDHYVDEAGRTVSDPTNVQRNKLQADMRLRLLEKMHPRKYGAKVDMNHGGQVGNPIRLIAANMTQEESTQLYSEMLKVGR